MDRPPGVLLVMAAGALVGGCGSSDDTSESCLRAHDAEVCAEGGEGSVRISADGFLPGSDLLLDPGGSDPQVHEIGDDGRPSGAIGFLGGTGSGPLVIGVTGTAADGSEVDGEIVTDHP